MEGSSSKLVMLPRFPFLMLRSCLGFCGHLLFCGCLTFCAGLLFCAYRRLRSRCMCRGCGSSGCKAMPVSVIGLKRLRLKREENGDPLIALREIDQQRAILKHAVV